MLNIFEGRLTITDILTMPMSLLKSLQKVKEKELEVRNKEMSKIRNGETNKQMTVSSNGRRFVDKTYN